LSNFYHKTRPIILSPSLETAEKKLSINLDTKLIGLHLGRLFQKLILPPSLETSVTGEILSLPAVTRDDMGSYMCIAQNGVPPAISKSYKLIVNCKYLTK
jgi:hypothetical protein